MSASVQLTLVRLIRTDSNQQLVLLDSGDTGFKEGTFTYQHDDTPDNINLTNAKVLMHRPGFYEISEPGFLFQATMERVGFYSVTYERRISDGFGLWVEDEEDYELGARVGFRKANVTYRGREFNPNFIPKQLIDAGFEPSGYDDEYYFIVTLVKRVRSTILED